MLELNLVYSLLIGTLAAAIWGGVSIRRLLRSGRYKGLGKIGRSAVWCVAGLAFVPALLIAINCAVRLAGLAVKAGPWSHIILNLVVFSIVGIVGAAVPVITALFVARLVLGRTIPP
jgi:hypothetical protein